MKMAPLDVALGVAVATEEEPRTGISLSPGALDVMLPDWVRMPLRTSDWPTFMCTFVPSFRPCARDALPTGQ